jgi:hypothetical protein
MPDDPATLQDGQATAQLSWDAMRQELARDVDRLADRLRNLSQARLAAAAPPHPSRAAAARAAAQTLADAAAGLEAGPDPTGPTWRTVPDLGDFAVGDQLAVTGHDLIAAAESTQPDDDAWGHHGRRTAHEVLTEAADALETLRRHL